MTSIFERALGADFLRLHPLLRERNILVRKAGRR